MSPLHRHRLCHLAIAAVVMLVASAAAAQQPPAASPPAAASSDSPQTRLARVRQQILSNPGRMSDAIPELTQILAADPTIAEAHMLLGVAYRAAGGPMMAEAKAELQQALDLEPGLIAARLLLAQVYMDIGRYDSARDEANAGLVDVPGQPQFLAVLAESERHLGDPARALQLNRLALEADPSLAEAHFYLAMAMLDLGQRDEAIHELETLAKSGIGAPDVYLRLGAAYLDANQIDSAIAAFTQGARIAPANREIHVELARAFRLKGAIAQAEEQLASARPQAGNVQASGADERIDAAYNLETGLLRLQQNRLPAAADALGKAVTLAPNDGEGHRALAEVYARQGARAKAREEAAQADALGAPISAELRAQLGLPPAPAAPAKGRE